MKNSKNSVSLTGFAGRDPEIKNFESGNKVARVSIAVNASYKREDTWVERTEWFDLVFWNAKVDLLNLVGKSFQFNLISTRICVVLNLPVVLPDIAIWVVFIKS